MDTETLPKPFRLIEPPDYWKEQFGLPDHPPNSGNIPFRAWTHGLAGLNVFRSLSKAGGEDWIHISVARRDRMPTWQELSKVRLEFLGEEIEAYHVIPRKEDYINIHAFCLHIWAPRDFTRRIANLQDLTWETAI